MLWGYFAKALNSHKFAKYLYHTAPETPQLVTCDILLFRLRQGGRTIFPKDGDYEAFLERLAAARQRYPFYLYAYVLGNLKGTFFFFSSLTGIEPRDGKEKGTFYISISFLGRPLGLRLAVKPSSAAMRETHAAEP